MSLSRISLIAFLVVSFLSGCEQQSESGKQWQADEVLLHMAELRKEVAALRNEVKSLKNDIANVKAVAGPSKIKSLPLAGQASLGDEKASLAIIEFSDYQCPYCVRHAKQVYPELKKNFIDSGKVKYFVRNFPLSFHAKARDASIVAECAGKQGKQWPAHEFLFANSRQLGDATFDIMIKKFALNKTEFDNCRIDPVIAAKVDADIVLGQQNGVSGTPKFFIGRIKNNMLVDAVPLSGAQYYKAFERIINALDKKS